VLCNVKLQARKLFVSSELRAEGVGFEPTVPLRARLISSHVSANSDRIDDRFEFDQRGLATGSSRLEKSTSLPSPSLRFRFPARMTIHLIARTPAVFVAEPAQIRRPSGTESRFRADGSEGQSSRTFWHRLALCHDGSDATWYRSNRDRTEGPVC
jgi:hypothetical protein